MTAISPAIPRTPEKEFTAKTVGKTETHDPR